RRRAILVLAAIDIVEVAGLSRLDPLRGIRGARERGAQQREGQKRGRDEAGSSHSSHPRQRGSVRAGLRATAPERQKERGGAAGLGESRLQGVTAIPTSLVPSDRRSVAPALRGRKPRRIGRGTAFPPAMVVGPAGLLTWPGAWAS